ncbi:MAG: ATPase [Candidatus Omnitrophica bacterium]|nr:ATPase [Candidatus Omnitrophota bacterium]
MEKVTALIFHKAKEDFLSELQGLGVIHIALEKLDATDQTLGELKDSIKRCESFLKTAKDAKTAGTQPEISFDGDVPTLIGVYEKTLDEIASLRDRIEKSDKELSYLNPWGEFDSASLKRLAEAGISTRFFVAPVKRFQSLDLENACYQEVARDKTYVHFVLFERAGHLKINCDECPCPDTDRKTLENQRDIFREEKAKKEQFLAALYRRTAAVEECLNAQRTRYAFHSISANLEAAAEGAVFVLKGWLPRSDKKRVQEFLNGRNVYFYFESPAPDEAVPILLKNNRFARLFEPITRLFDLPDYTEFDLTPFFAPFFTLFFGFCLGDAGYGLLLVIAGAVCGRRFPPDKRTLAVLLMILGISTFACGLMSGTLFGFDFSQIPGANRVVLFDQNRLFQAALILGVIQVLFGMLLKAINRIRQYGVAAGLSSIGWILLVGGLLSMMVVHAAVWAAAAGALLILLFNDMQANIFVRIGKGLWELYGITGVFGDILSYIRLFALGISSSILGFVINEIAFQLRSIPVAGFLLTLVVLLVGHTGNLLLSALSSFVHPLRLTFVEFYKSVGFQGGGKAYSPFKKSTV